MSSSRRNFFKKAAVAAVGTAGITIGGAATGMSAKSYSKIIGSNEKINLAIMGLGARLYAFYNPIKNKQNNVELLYLCDVVKSQREKAAQNFSEHIDYKPKLENDIRKIIEDKDVDAIINAAPDHWHAPGSIMALVAGKHVYVEKPCSHNLNESDMLVAAQKKYNKVVQMGNQQRSYRHTINIINRIHNGIIGVPYKAVAFLSSKRGEVPVQQVASVPEGLDWDLFQGPAVRREYIAGIERNKWHWYGWDYGTAEVGNNGTHE